MNLIEKETTGTKQVVCQRCNHEWMYKGTNPYICTCPFCRTTVTLNKKIIDHDSNITYSKLINKSFFTSNDEELKAIQRSIALLRQDLRKIMNEELIKFLNHKQQQ